MLFRDPTRCPTVRRAGHALRRRLRAVRRRPRSHAAGSPSARRCGACWTGAGVDVRPTERPRAYAGSGERLPHRTASSTPTPAAAWPSPSTTACPASPTCSRASRTWRRSIDALVAADPEALLLTPGPGRAAAAQGRPRQAGARAARRHRQRLRARGARAAGLVDVRRSRSGLAVRLDAACVIANLQDVPRPALAARDRACRTSCACAAQCSRAEMPLMVEPVPMAPKTARLRRPPRRRAPARAGAPGHRARGRPRQV